jgi:hypothetical protein
MDLQPPQEGPLPLPSYRRRPRRVTWRAIGIALLLTIVNDYWIVQLEVALFFTYAVPFYNCVFTLLVVTANLRSGGDSPGRAFQDRAARDLRWVPSPARCSHNIRKSWSHDGVCSSRPENKWAGIFLDRLPHWLTVSDPEPVQLYHGPAL